MDLPALPINERAARINRKVESIVNRVVRGRDRLRGRAADYDDTRYEFVGGANDEMRRRHYDKSLRLLWKAEAKAEAEAEAPWSTFRDLTAAERQVRDMAERVMSADERRARARIGSAEFRAMLDRTYTPRQKQAIVHILSAIGHGEAYAWLISASNLRDVRSSGAKAAVTFAGDGVSATAGERPRA